MSTDKTWQSRSACTPETSYLFYPDTRWERQEFTPEAKALCGWCLVRDECLTWALETRDPFGTHGGLTATERQKLLEGKPLVCKRGHDVSGPQASDKAGYCRQCRRENERAARVRKKAAA